jgi:hypothetical protein
MTRSCLIALNAILAESWADPGINEGIFRTCFKMQDLQEK